MNSEAIRTFIMLSKLKNFTRTAERLYVAQSTVTNRIAELEAETGKKLFARIRQMSAKEYTNSVYHKTGVEAARKKRIYTAFISEERDRPLRGNRPAKKPRKIEKK